MDDQLLPDAHIEATPEGARCTGEWTVEGIGRLTHHLSRLRWPQQGKIVIDVSAITHLDTTGVLLLERTLVGLQRGGRTAELAGLRPEHQALLELVRDRRAGAGAVAPPPVALGMIAALGQAGLAQLARSASFLSFVGEVTLAFARSVMHPRRIRWKALFANLESAGVRALPIVALLSFLMGIVIAYQGGEQLKIYGANTFIVELVSLTMLRELAPLITAIIVAGRTGSAYTAQIGTMMVEEEVDALRTMGIAPMDLLVLPKLFALMIALPLLVVFADVLSVFGGMVLASSLLDVSFSEFLNRFQEVVSPTSFLIGIAKAPVFAMVIALVGCYQGFRVSGGADGVGRQTTLSVVQSIFFVILVDAFFSVTIGGLGL
jgi:phospholipid/cholesterol/gamma-HCH transport system permease protein